MSEVEKQNDWQLFKQYTAARIGLKTISTSVEVKETLAFRLAHAHARDAVYSMLALNELIRQLQELTVETVRAQSQASSREEYLQRPDKGRKLNVTSQAVLASLKQSFDLVFVLADGLSAEAINKHALPVLKIVLPELQKQKLAVAPIVIAEQARVALADEIGSLLKSKLSLIFIGERPGLSSPDSMGVYITYNPQPGTTDEARNCISNIRPEGLSYQQAADTIIYFTNVCLRLKLSGVNVKDNASLLS